MKEYQLLRHHIRTDLNNYYEQLITIYFNNGEILTHKRFVVKSILTYDRTVHIDYIINLRWHLNKTVFQRDLYSKFNIYH